MLCLDLVPSDPFENFFNFVKIVYIYLNLQIFPPSKNKLKGKKKVQNINSSFLLI